MDDFHYYSEELYRKSNGEFFLHGKGNVLSPYADDYGLTGSQAGEKIRPLTIDEAKKYLQNKGITVL